LIGYGEIDPRLLSGVGEVSLKFRRVEKGGRKGFQVFRVYGSIEAPVGELWMGKTAAYFKVSKEGLRRFVEEAERTTPDLSGIRKIWQTLEWLNTDVSFTGRQIEGSTVHLWQLKWYFALFGGGRVSGGVADVTEEDIKLKVTMRWSRETLDRIIAEEGEELEPLLGRPVKSWRELVDAIDWSWVLERVREMADVLKPWIGPERASDVEREGLVRRMLGELALLVHFAEARRGMDDGEWREERAKRLAKAVETLSGGRIAGDHAERLARAIIRYAGGHKKEAKEDIDRLAGELVGALKEDVNRVKGEVWGVVEFVLSDMYCLARDCADDRVIRKFIAPALELIMLDKALRGEFNREEALLRFGEMYATALAGDGHVRRRSVMLTVGGELGGGAALLRLATLHLLNQLLSDELKFNARLRVGQSVYRIAARGEDAARLMRFLAVSAPSAGGEYLSNKFNKFMEAAKVEVRVDNIRLTEGNNVAADLTLSEAGVAVKYNVYLHGNAIRLQFASTDRSRVELAARLLKLVGVSAEVKKVGDGGVWRIWVATNRLATGHEKLRKALVEFVKTVHDNGWVEAGKADSWLEELEKGRVLREGWPEYHMELAKGGLKVRFTSTNPDNIEREVQRLRDMGFEEGRHFSVKMPEDGKNGYISILREGLAYAAWLSVHGSEDQRKLAAEFVEYILQRAREAGNEVYEKAREIVDEGKARGLLTLRGLEKKAEVNGREHMVKVIDGGAEFDEGRGGKKLLRIKITAEVDGVKSEYTITYGRYERNVAKGFSVARADVPGGRKADAERLAAVVKAITGKEPRIIEKSNGTIEAVYGSAHLKGFMRYAELADDIARWLEETGRR
jgi:hypothetical protein